VAKPIGLHRYERSLRLVFPQWQGGGNRPHYQLGSLLLDWLAPATTMPVEVVPIEEASSSLEIERGIFARQTVLNQARAARAILDRHRPDRVVILGGDCSVDFAPFAYLNQHYEGDLAFIWLDAHPDLVVPDGIHSNFHAMVLSALLGFGDPEFIAEMAAPVDPNRVMFAGLRAETEFKTALEAAHGISIPITTVEQIRAGSEPILDWLRSTGAKHVAIHFDLDVLEMNLFRSTAGPEPDGLSPDDVVRLLTGIATEFDIVGLGITEYLAREAALLRDLLHQLPIVADG
jgi:arginase